MAAPTELNLAQKVEAGREGGPIVKKADDLPAEASTPEVTAGLEVPVESGFANTRGRG